MHFRRHLVANIIINKNSLLFLNCFFLKKERKERKERKKRKERKERKKRKERKERKKRKKENHIFEESS
jgi:hypothetical protein